MIRGPHQCKGKQCIMNLCPSITTIWEYGFRARRFAAPRNDSGECSGTQRYLKVIKSVRLRVEALFFKGSLVAFALF